MRVSGAQQILDAKIEEWRRVQFAWGTADCCQFVGDVVLALTGVDHRAQFAVYADQAEAEALVEAAGGMIALLTQCFGLAKPVASARRGDVVMIDGGLGMVPGICLGLHSAVISSQGLLLCETRRAVAAWTV